MKRLAWKVLKIMSSGEYRTPNERAFDTIYKRRTWGGDGSKTSLSGSGSSLAESKNLCALLVNKVTWVAELRRRPVPVRFLDAGMGDWFWMSDCLPKMAHALPHGAKLHYQGVDVASTAIAIASSRGRPVATRLAGIVTIAPFLLVDLAVPGSLRSLPLPRYDLIMCNDALMHLPTRDIVTALHNINAVGGRLFITNTATAEPAPSFRGRLVRRGKQTKLRGGSRWQMSAIETSPRINEDIPAGKFRGVDIKRPPFSVPGLRESVRSSTPDEQIEVALCLLTTDH